MNEDDTHLALQEQITALEAKVNKQAKRIAALEGQVLAQQVDVDGLMDDHGLVSTDGNVK